MKIYVKESSIHGHGIFAKQDIKRGEIVTIIKGKRHFKINKTMKDVFLHPDWIGYDLNKWIDPISPHRYWNHSCNPSTGIKGRFLITALRDIKKNEEITTDYSIIESDPRWFLKCSCGEKDCRKTVRSIDFLPYKLFNKYTPFIPSAFKKKYERDHKSKK